jgi:hypothetical protein
MISGCCKLKKEKGFLMGHFEPPAAAKNLAGC